MKFEDRPVAVLAIDDNGRVLGTKYENLKYTIAYVGANYPLDELVVLKKYSDSHKRIAEDENDIVITNVDKAFMLVDENLGAGPMCVGKDEVLMSYLDFIKNTHNHLIYEYGMDKVYPVVFNKFIEDNYLLNVTEYYDIVGKAIHTYCNNELDEEWYKNILVNIKENKSVSFLNLYRYIVIAFITLHSHTDFNTLYNLMLKTAKVLNNSDIDNNNEEEVISKIILNTFIETWHLSYGPKQAVDDITYLNDYGDTTDRSIWTRYKLISVANTLRMLYTDDEQSDLYKYLGSYMADANDEVVYSSTNGYLGYKDTKTDKYILECDLEAENVYENDSYYDTAKRWVSFLREFYKNKEYTCEY